MTFSPSVPGAAIGKAWAVIASNTNAVPIAARPSVFLTVVAVAFIPLPPDRSREMNPVQTIDAVCTCLNGGRWMRDHVSCQSASHGFREDCHFFKFQNVKIRARTRC